VSLAPDLFDVDDLGNSVVLVTGALSPDQERGARAAEANCPERAVEIHDADRGRS
jgi:ferredoxin